MSILTSKIRKLQRALEMHGEVYLISRAQIYSEKLDKVCTKFVLDKIMTWEEYQALNPETKRKPRKTVRENVIESFKEIDVLLALAEAYKRLEGVMNDG